MNWQIPYDAWQGQTVFILGGGPSLKGFDASVLKGQGKVIGINEAGLTMAPWSDILFWADRRWLDWNHERLHLHAGEWKVTRKRPHIDLPYDVKSVRFLPRRFSHWPDAVGGWCSGSSCVNLAYLLGARRVVLLGFDMHDLPAERWREGNWHNRHQEPPLTGQRTNRFIPAFEVMAPILKDRGVEVLNATPGSALQCFPFANLKDLIHA
jgi:hypothetical protein